MSKKLIVAITLSVVVVACALWYISIPPSTQPVVIDDGGLRPPKQDTTAKATTKAPETVLPETDGYSFQTSDYGGTLHIYLHKKEIATIATSSIPYSTDPRNTAEFADMPPSLVIIYPGITELIQKGYDKALPPAVDTKRNSIYFAAQDNTGAGNVNSEKIIFSYNLITKKITKIYEDFGSGFSSLSVSPNGSYLVFDDGDHGGACSNAYWLSVLDLNTNTTIDRTPLYDGYPDGKSHDGYSEFNRWLSDNSFQYTETVETYDQCEANVKPTDTMKTFVISDKTP